MGQLEPLNHPALPATPPLNCRSNQQGLTWKYGARLVIIIPSLPLVPFLSPFFPMRRRLSGLLYLMAVVGRTWSVGGVVMRTNAVQGDGVKEEGTDGPRTREANRRRRRTSGLGGSFSYGLLAHLGAFLRGRALACRLSL